MVALFTRAWIEITRSEEPPQYRRVALFTRAWIEMKNGSHNAIPLLVALFTRAWIEIAWIAVVISQIWSPSSRGRGLK